MRRRLWLWLGLLGLGLTGLILYLVQAFPGATEEPYDRVRLLSMIGWLALLCGSLVLHISARPGTALRQAAAWVALGFVLVLGYSYRNDLGDLQARVMGELLPQRGTPVGQDGVRFRASNDGHFHVRAEVDGTPLTFMVDSGASDVVLSLADARRLGFDPDRLSFTLSYRTANGPVRAAPVQLREVVIGPLRLFNVAAAVNEQPMSASLLGMSFLSRLAGYEVRDGTLTLWQ